MNNILNVNIEWILSNSRLMSPQWRHVITLQLITDINDIHPILSDMSIVFQAIRILIIVNLNNCFYRAIYFNGICVLSNLQKMYTYCIWFVLCFFVFFCTLYYLAYLHWVLFIHGYSMIAINTANFLWHVISNIGHQRILTVIIIVKITSDSYHQVVATSLYWPCSTVPKYS